jgi:hypothetical protein
LSDPAASTNPVTHSGVNQTMSPKTMNDRKKETMLLHVCHMN